MTAEELNKKYKGKNDSHSNGVYESKKSDVISITESDIRKIVNSCVNRILTEISTSKLGEYEVMDGFLRSCMSPSLKQFGRYNDVRLYYSPSHTYCLMRREDNGTLFFTEIVTAPELGKNETKYVPLRPHEVPPIILQNAQSLLRKAKNQHTVLS